MSVIYNYKIIKDDINLNKIELRYIISQQIGY